MLNYLSLSSLPFYSTTSDFVLRAVPYISDEYANLASKIRIAFTGDPSFFAYNGEEEEPEPEDPDAPPVERFREVHRLAFTVKVTFCRLVPCTHCFFGGPHSFWAVAACTACIINGHI